MEILSSFRRKGKVETSFDHFFKSKDAIGIGTHGTPSWNLPSIDREGVHTRELFAYFAMDKKTLVRIQKKKEMRDFIGNSSRRYMGIWSL